MVPTPGKCNCLLIGNHEEPNKKNLNGTETASTKKENPLGVLIDKKLSFDVHIKSLCKKAVQNFSALPSVVT